MAENSPAVSFGKTDHLYSITNGYVVVKKNIITGSIKAKGTYKEETISPRTMRLSELSNEQLADLLTRAQNRGATSHISVFQTEIDRRAQGLDPIPGVSDRSVKLPGRSDFIRRRISAKLGIKFRWPWQSMLVLPTTEREIDTPVMTVDTKEKIRLSFDTDYRYRIIDPEAFAVEFNSRENSGNAFNEIETMIGRLIDEVVKKYIKEHLEQVQKSPSMDLLQVLSYEVAEATQNFGIEVTRLFVKDIILPNNIVEAEAARKAADAQAEAQRKQQLVEASKQAMEKEALLAMVKNMFPSLSDEAILQQVNQMIAAGTITTSINTPGVPIAQAPQPVQQGQQQTGGPQPTRPANAPDWFDDYVGTIYDESGKILPEVWEFFKQSHQNVSPFPPKVTVMPEDLFDEICKELSLNPPVRGQQI